MVKNPPVYTGTPSLFSLNPSPPIYIAPSSHLPQQQLHTPHFPGKPFLCGCIAAKQNMQHPYIPQHGPKAEANPTSCCAGLFVETECCRRVFPAQWGGNPRRSWSVPVPGNCTESGNIPWYTQNQGTSHDTLPRALHLCFTFISG